MVKKAQKKIFGLNVKEFLLSVVLPIMTFVVGCIVIPIMLSFNESYVVRQNKDGGSNQESVKKLPAVKAYLDFLALIEHKDFDKAWGLLTVDKQNKCGSKSSLQYDFYLTNHYEIIYIIPRSEDRFYFLMNFYDEVDKDKEDIVLKNIVKGTPLVSSSSVLGIEDVLDQGTVTNELFAFINNRFVVENEDEVRNTIDSYIRRSTMFSIVECDWRTPILIAKDLNLPPKRRESSIFTMESAMLVQSVEMQKEGKEWKVKDYHTEALSKWDQQQTKK